MLCILFFCVLCEKKYVILYLSLCHSVLQKSPVSLPHSVILSSKKHLSHFVIMSFCLQKKHLSLSVTLSFCLQKKHLSLFVIMSFCLHKNICLSFSLCHYVGRQRIKNLDKTVQKKTEKRVCLLWHTLFCYVITSKRKSVLSVLFISFFHLWCIL